MNVICLKIKNIFILVIISKFFIALFYLYSSKSKITNNILNGKILSSLQINSTYVFSGLQWKEEIGWKSIGPCEGDVRQVEEEKIVAGRSLRVHAFRIDRRCWQVFILGFFRIILIFLFIGFIENLDWRMVRKIILLC